MENTKVCKVCGKELPITDFAKGKAHGVEFTMGVCKECVKQRQVEGHKKAKESKAQKKIDEVAQARQMRLEEFTPRELMERLAKLGYRGKLEYVQVTEIDITNF